MLSLLSNFTGHAHQLGIRLKCRFWSRKSAVCLNFSSSGAPGVTATSGSGTPQSSTAHLPPACLKCRFLGWASDPRHQHLQGGAQASAPGASSVHQSFPTTGPGAREQVGLDWRNTSSKETQGVTHKAGCRKQAAFVELEGGSRTKSLGTDGGPGESAALASSAEDGI